MKAILYKQDETEKEVYPKNPAKGFQLEELYEMLGCQYIETVPAILEGHIIIVDEEGKFNSSNTINWAATGLARIFAYDHIVGSALLCPSIWLK